MNEKWKKTPIVPNLIEASNFGRIRDAKTREILSLHQNPLGYWWFGIKIDGKWRIKIVHRCVLSAFHPVVGYEKLYVHHIDFNPSNNKIENLKWCTQKENLLYSVEAGRCEKSRKVASEKFQRTMRDGTHPFLNLTKEQHKQKYITRSKNYKEKGNHPNKGKFGLKGTNSKLTISMVIEIKERHKNGEKAIRIAESLNLSRQTIDNVIHDKKKYL